MAGIFNKARRSVLFGAGAIAGFFAKTSQGATMPSLMPTGKQQYFYPGSPSPLVGGKLYTYAAGTSTPQPTYQDAAGTIPNTNPITLDSTGSALIYWSGSYKIVLKDAAGNTVYTVDNYSSPDKVISDTISGFQLADYAALRAFSGVQKAVYLTGYLATSAPTGVAGMFVRDDHDTTTADNGGTVIVTANGVRWKRSFTGSVKAAWFGADPSGAADSTAAIQAAITYGMYVAAPAAGVVELEAGSFKTSDTLNLGYGTDFREITLVGAGSAYRGAGFAGTTILPTFSDRPAIAVQGGRRVKIKSLALIGLNQSFVQNGDFGGNTSIVDDTVMATWISGTLNANANSQYAPYAGIAVDPYAGAAPAPAYPNVTFPAVVSSPGQYNKAFTDTCRVEDCYIGGFVVGAVVQPSGADGNGDFVSFYDTVFEYLPMGASAGNSQAREMNFFNCGFRNVHTCLTNNKHGRKIGHLGGAMVGCHFDRTIRIFDFDDAYCGTVGFYSCYGELVWSLGNVSTSPTRAYPIAFNSSEFSMSGHPAQRGVAARLVYGTAGMPIAFNGGKLQLDSATCTGTDIVFDGTFVDSLDCTQVTPSAGRQLAQEVIAGVMQLGAANGNNKSRRMRSAVTPGAPFEADTTAPLKGRGTTLPRIARFGEWVGSGTPAVPCPHGLYAAFGKGSATANLAGTGGTIDFTAAGAFLQFGVRPGDVVQDDQTGTMLLVTANAGLVATVAALNNYSNPGSGAAFRDAVSGTVGNWYVQNSRVYGTTYPNYGDITNGSAVIANVGRADGYAGFLNADIAVGDYIWQHDWLTKYFPASATITAFDTAARTITMSAAAIKTAAAVPLNFWVRA